jgi:hypothetical protein
LTGSAGRVLPTRGQCFTLELKQPRFDRTGTTKSPQQACQSMNELELDHGSRINTADEVTLKRSVGPNMFEILNDGLVGKPIAQGAVATAFVLQIDTGNIRNILLGGFGRPPHRHW